MIAIRRKKVNWVRVLFLLCCTVIPLVHFCIFYVYVNVNSFVMAFQQYEKGEMFWTIGNFTRFFEELANADSELIEAICNTCITFLINQIMFGLSILVSYFLYKKIKGYRVFQVIFYLPLIISGVTFANVFSFFVDAAGPLGQVLASLGVDPVPELLANSDYATTTIVIYTILIGWGGNMLLLCGALARVPLEVLEAARLDGVGPFRELCVDF